MSNWRRSINILLGVSKDRAGDKGLICLVGVIIIFGLIMLASASSVASYNVYGDSYFIFKRQIFFLILSLFVYWFFSKIDYHKWKKYAFFMLIFSIILLTLVFIPGLRGDWGTAKSWINIFGFSLQPSEFVKITFLLYLAAWLESRKNKLTEITQGIGPFLIAFSVLALLMLLQPDVGTLFILTLTSFLVYFVGGGNIKHILFIVLIGILALAIMIHFKPYQADRFRCLIDSNYSRQDTCYQINQSLIAVGSGGLFGRGLGASRQKYSYLPEVSGDSIFAIIGEETGLIFSAILVILYLLLFYKGFLISKSAPDNFGKILAIGMVGWITFQAFINIGGMINLIPMTGVPLPFISRGGSSLMSALAAIGILVNISKQTKSL
ncbi:MAG: putative lipid II flippase FtsW [bacterium]|nr:putative lipid II flippase FtsW [bacterium]